MTRVRILILTSSTGAGHDARAQAFAEWCFELYRYNVDVRIEQMLEKSSGFFSAGVRFYNWIQQKSPWIHKAFYLFVELLSLLNRRSVSFGRSYYEEVLREYQPHLVFSVHDCLNRGYFQLARKVLGPRQGALRHLWRRVFRGLRLQHETGSSRPPTSTSPALRRPGTTP